MTIEEVEIEMQKLKASGIRLQDVDIENLVRRVKIVLDKANAVTNNATA